MLLFRRQVADRVSDLWLMWLFFGPLCWCSVCTSQSLVNALSQRLAQACLSESSSRKMETSKSHVFSLSSNPHEVWNVLHSDHIIPIRGLRGQDIQTSPFRNSFHNWNVQLQWMSPIIYLAASSLFFKLRLSASAGRRSRSDYAMDWAHCSGCFILKIWVRVFFKLFTLRTEKIATLL